MPITTERIAKLREFGLSEYAARTYLALLDLGTSEARDVSALSKVPASKIYHILDQLHEKGLTVILPEFPRKYEPVPFHDFLQRIHDEHASAANAIRRERPSLEQMFAVAGDVSGSDRGGFALLRGRRNALERMDEMMQSARHDVLLLATPGLLRSPRAWRDGLATAVRQGARVRVLVPAEAAGQALAGELADLADVRTRPASAPVHSGSVVVADGRQALVVHFLPDDGHATEGNDTALYIDQEGAVAVLADLVEAPWREARALAAAGGARAVPLEEETPASATGKEPPGQPPEEPSPHPPPH